jgi:hypothetical protein
MSHAKSNSAKLFSRNSLLFSLKNCFNSEVFTLKQVEGLAEATLYIAQVFLAGFMIDGLILEQINLIKIISCFLGFIIFWLISHILNGIVRL